jgi:hydrogenase nickel incorporation protein HypA/HybF
MAQAFGFIAAGTEADGAAVEVVTVPATVRCRDCGTASETDDLLAVCPHCKGSDVEISGGDELVLESVSYGPGAGPLQLAGSGSLRSPPETRVPPVRS